MSRSARDARPAGPPPPPQAAGPGAAQPPAHRLSRRRLLQILAAGPPLLLLPIGASRIGAARRQAGADAVFGNYDWTAHNWGYAVDATRCIGCLACMRACRAENRVPRGSYRTWVERYRIDARGEAHVDLADEEQGFAPLPGAVAKAFFVPKLCNHCEKSVCSQVCPVGASYQTRDGVVLVDHEHCVGCGYCVQACPYGTRYIDPVTHEADKCTLCYHRITRGLQPACVLACPVEARICGDLKDPRSRLSTLLKQRRHTLLRPELGTHPKCFYIGLDPEVV